MLLKKIQRIKVDIKPPPFEVELVPYITSFSSDINPNFFSVVHETIYQYSSPVSNSKHLLRLQPLNDIDEQILLNYNCHISSDGEICNFRGAFGNNTTFVMVKDKYTELKITSQSVVCITEKEKSDELIHQPRTLPMIWMPWDRIMMEAYLQVPELPEYQLFELADYAMTFVKRNNYDVMDVIEDINQTICREFEYLVGLTNLTTTPYQVYTLHKGVCQDFATLLITLARLLNIPARYRVGYIDTGGDYENKIQSDASHAWVEVFLPYLGWIGFDPTNGCIAGKNHIKVACGRHYLDATPTSGTIFNADVGTTETLSTGVQVLRLNL